MSHVASAQEGVLSDPTEFAEYLTFTLDSTPTPQAAAEAVGRLDGIAKSIGQKDTTARLSVTVGFSATGWPRLFPTAELPAELRVLPELSDGPRVLPSTPGDIFVMVKSRRLDLNYQAAKYVFQAFKPFATLADDVLGFKYLDDRDLIDFVDGTENPKGAERAAAVLTDQEPYAGGSYLLIQKYLDRQSDWDALTAEEQEGVIGRTKMDDIEIADAAKKPYAHNVKSKLTIDGEEIKIFRQNRAFGNALAHGTMFVGFAASAQTLESSLRQMVTADEDGNYDKLLDFVDAVAGTSYFVPPVTFLDSLG